MQDQGGLGRTPDVPVLMTVYNGLPYDESAVRSMMAQTLRNIEIVVVDDASTDGTPEVLDRLAREDGRVRVERLETNQKQARASNRGLELARAPLVARMDADDLSEPERLEVQKRYMDAHPEAVLLGASIREINGDGRVLRTTANARSTYAVRWISRFFCAINHPTFMFRARLPDGTAPSYDPAWTKSDDYDFIVRMLAHGDVVALPDVLVSCRVYAASDSANNWKLQQAQGREIAQHHLEAELPDEVIAGLGPFRASFHDRAPSDPAAMFAGLRRMVADDVARTPSERSWVRQHAANMARQAMVRSGRGRGAILRAFFGPGRDFLPDMALRAVRTRVGPLARSTLRRALNQPSR